MNRYNNNSFSSSVRNRNPFDDDDDQFDYKFGNKNNNNSSNQDEDDLKQIQEKIGRIENDSLESTYRALRVLNETQEVGVATATELVRQGEKLRDIDGKLDDVNQTLTNTQKNINQIKSVFGGLRNKFFSSKSSSDSKPISPITTSKSQSAMNTINQKQESKAEFQSITGSDREKELNRNLDEMSLGLNRLKALGLEMQNELDRQDPLIDRLNNKVDRTQTRITDQNAQMKKS